MAGRRKKPEDMPELAESAEVPEAAPAAEETAPGLAIAPPEVPLSSADTPDAHPATALPDPGAEPPLGAVPPRQEPFAPAAEPLPVAPPARRSSPLLLILGGLIAAGLGFALAQAVPDGWPLAATSRHLSELDARLTAQDRKLAELTPDTGLADRLAALESRIAELPDPSAEIAALRAELAGLGNNTPELDALRTELDQLRAELAAVPRAAAGELEALKAAAQTEREAAEARAAALQAEAEATARSAVLRGAVLRVQAALEAGGAFDTALADLAGAGLAVPEALASHAEGVPTLAQLQAGFPDAARAALAATHTPDPDATLTDRLGAFLKAQTSIRSVTPRDGTDPDAILSRAEAALHGGGLTAVLAELDGLPPEAAAAMADWRAQADTRAAAAAAVAALAADLNAN